MHLYFIKEKARGHVMGHGLTPSFSPDPPYVNRVCRYFPGLS